MLSYERRAIETCDTQMCNQAYYAYFKSIKFMITITGSIQCNVITRATTMFVHDAIAMLTYIQLVGTLQPGFILTDLPPSGLTIDSSEQRWA